MGLFWNKKKYYSRKNNTFLCIENVPGSYSILNNLPVWESI